MILYPLSSIVSFLASTPSNNKDPIYLFYSQVSWWGVWQRPQEEAMGFARHHRILYLSPVQAHEPLTRYDRWKRTTVINHGRGLTVFTPMIFSGQYRWDFIFRLNRLLLIAELRWFLRNEAPAVFFTNSPFSVFLTRSLKFSKIIYDIIDDFAAFDWAPRGAEVMERQLLELADVVLTGTQTLWERKRHLCRKATYVPCGVAFERFAPPEEPSTIEPEDVRGLPKPWIGYMGTLSERIDSGIISELARRLPKASILLIGPVHRSLRVPPRAPNIHYLGLKKHEDLPSYLHQVQVALMPFKLTEAAKAINPVKTLEYLAAGCVVVSTAIPDVVRFYSDVVLIASSPRDFVDKVAMALNEDQTQRIREGIEKARRESWSHMVERMENLIRDENRSK